MNFKYLPILLSLSLMACQSKNMSTASQSLEQDKYLWLEEVEGVKALEFARTENERSLGHFRKDPNFKSIEAEVRKIILAKDRQPALRLINGELYNFWQDEIQVRGVWRKTTIEKFKTGKPDWDVILDIDRLAKDENENWVWAGASHLTPSYDRVLIYLSRGGKDAAVIREFDLKSRSFVKEGFNVPESKGMASWIDKDNIYLTSNFGPDSMTTSGYPRILKMWKRGTPLSEAQEVLRADKTDMRAYGVVSWDGDKPFHFVGKTISFYEWQPNYREATGNLIPSPFPRSARMQTLFKGFTFFELKEDLGKFKTGSIVAISLDSWKEGPKALEKAQLVFAPTDKRFVEWVSRTKNHLMISVIDNIVSKVLKADLDAEGNWKLSEVVVGSAGMTGISSIDEESDKYLISYVDFLTPPSVYLADASDKKNHMQLLTESKRRFESKDMSVERFEVQSADGTLIPYFMVAKKNLKKDGKNPTLLYGYGGFEHAMQPSYRGVLGKVWLERGGVYILSNIRGGGEFGPLWHRSVLKENRYKVYEDFIAIAEDLIKRGITSPAHLGIHGGSNGGLLVGATAMLRPELFNAVLCEVPLLDMVRYHKLLAGASWMDEYGNPEDPKMLPAILKYSPYQRVKPDVKYPEIFFMTSTKDDRVHPGHARKMFAKMKDMNHPVFYYENMEGGHGRNANLEQSILWETLQMTYLWEKIGPSKR